MSQTVDEGSTQASQSKLIAPHVNLTNPYFLLVLTLYFGATITLYYSNLISEGTAAAVLYVGCIALFGGLGILGFWRAAQGLLTRTTCLVRAVELVEAGAA